MFYLGLIYQILLIIPINLNFEMKTKKLLRLFVVIFILISTQNINAQLEIAFKPYRQIPKDTTVMLRINNFVKAKQLDSLMVLYNELSQEYLASGSIVNYLFVNNQVAANIVGIFHNLKLADSIQNLAMHKAIELNDTLSMEYVMLLKMRGTNYFYQYKDKESTDFFIRGYNLMKYMGQENVLLTDFKANIGNGYLNMGKPSIALPFLEQVLKESKEYNYPLLYMLVGQGIGHIAFNADKELGIETMTKVYHDALSLDLDSNSKNKFLANICYMLSGFNNEMGNKKEGAKYSKLAYYYINNTSIPDIYLRLSIYNSSLYDKIDAKDILTQQQIIGNILNALNKYDVKNPNLLTLSYRTILQSYNSQNITDSITKYKNKCIDLLEKIQWRERIRSYAIFRDIEADSTEKFHYAEKIISELISDYNPLDLNNDSVFLYETSPYIFYHNFYPALLTISDYYATNNKLDSAIGVLNTISNIVMANSNGVVEKSGGLTYSSLYEEVNDKKLSLLNPHINTESENVISKSILKNIANTQAFYLQKQMAFRQRSRTLENDSLWNNYFDLLLQKEQYKLNYQQAVIGKKSIDNKVYEDSTWQITLALIKTQILMNEKNLLFSPQIEDIKIANIQPKIANDELIINYYISEDSILYTVLLDQNNIEINKNTNYKEIKPLIKKFIRQLKTGSDILSETNMQLTKILIGDLNSTLTGKTKIVIIPHKELWSVPFEALSLNGKSMLIEDYAISYNTSLNVWAQARDKSIKKPLSFAGIAPVFNNQSSEISMRSGSFEHFSKLYNSPRSLMPALPYSKEEVELIGNKFNKKDLKNIVITNNKATESSFYNSINNYSIVHIATHGFVSKSNPMLTGIFFSSNNNYDDAYLFADEINNINPKASLVVLSSCNSGSGIIEGSEGINSLQRYFILAGVPNVLASLWKVHDKKTMELMDSFYSFLIQGNSYAKSMQLAKKEAIKKSTLPLDWAGFILIGE